MGLFRKLIFVAVLAAISLPCYAADTLKEMFSNGTVSGEVRSFYFDRDFDKDQKEREDLAIGGLMGYKTDALKGISFGLTFATANNMGSSDSKAVYGLLPADKNGDHDSVTRLQEAYIQGEWLKTTMRYGAQMINTPFMNGNDIRLLPKSYKGFSLVSKYFDNFEFQGYVITDYLSWSGDDFVSMGDFVNSKNDEPMLIGMAKYTLPIEKVNASLEGWQYHMKDTLNMSYVKASLGGKVDEASLRLTPVYFAQKSTGDHSAGKFDTDQYGFTAGASYRGASVDVFYAETGDNSLYTPWGDSRIINMQVLASEKANETAYAVKAAYDFASLGVKGLSANVFYGKFDADKKPKTKSTDASEVDFDVQYNLKYILGGMLDGLSIRARYAIINNEATSDYTDTRIYLKYTFALGK